MTSLEPLRLLEGQDSESNIWEIAWQQVKQDIKWDPPAEWEFNSMKTIDLVNHINQEAQDRAQKSENDQLYFTTWNGKQHTYREVYDNVARYADKFKTLADLIIKADSSYATLPWVSVPSHLGLLFTFADLRFRHSSALASRCVKAQRLSFRDKRILTSS